MANIIRIAALRIPASPLADALMVYPVCQEELYDPGRNVSINPNENSILTPQRPVLDVRLGYASTGQSKIMRGEGRCEPRADMQITIFPFRAAPFIAKAAAGFLALMV